jgi:hypothetical protein
MDEVIIDWDRLIREEMEWAISQKRKVVEDDAFRMQVKIVGPSGQIARTPLTWSSEQEKQKAMWAVSQVAKLTCSQAVMVIADARMTNVSGFCKRFGIAEPTTTAGYESFELERRRVMKGFDSYMGNLPADCYEDGLTVAIRGPRVTRVATTKYKVVKGVVVFEPMFDDKESKGTVEMVPAWWC